MEKDYFKLNNNNNDDDDDDDVGQQVATFDVRVCVHEKTVGARCHGCS